MATGFFGYKLPTAFLEKYGTYALPDALRNVTLNADNMVILTYSGLIGIAKLAQLDRYESDWGPCNEES